MKRTDNVYSVRQSDRRIKPPKEPKKLPRGTVLDVCPDDPELRCRGAVVMCLPGARVEVALRGGGILIVARSLVREVGA